MARLGQLAQRFHLLDDLLRVEVVNVIEAQLDVDLLVLVAADLVLDAERERYRAIAKAIGPMNNVKTEINLSIVKKRRYGFFQIHPSRRLARSEL